MLNIVLKYGVIIDKYVGDVIMIFFGDLESWGVLEDVLVCVCMVIEM